MNVQLFASHLPTVLFIADESYIETCSKSIDGNKLRQMLLVTLKLFKPLFV